MNESGNFNDREFEKMLVWKVTSLNMDIDVLEDENTRLQYEIDKYKKENRGLREKLGELIGGVGDDM